MLSIHSVFRGHHHGDIAVANDLEFHGQVHGSVTVAPGRQLFLHGRIAGDLIVEKDALAAIHGSVRGAVLNRDAHVYVLGSAGSVRDSGRGRTMVNHRPAVQRLNPAPTAVPLTLDGHADPVLGAVGRLRAGWRSWITG